MAARRARIVGYDLARSLAIFGMVIVNFKVVMGAERAGPAWLVWCAGLLDGRAAATFVVLAGVGIAMSSRRGRESGDRALILRDRNLLLRRALFLFVIGLLYTPIWPADILHFYGVYMGIAAFMLAATTGRLIGTSVGVSLLFMLLLFSMDYERGWDWASLSYEGFWTPDGMLRHLFFNGFHPVVPWLAFLLLGMALGRLDLRNELVRSRLLRWSIASAAGAEVAGWSLRRAVQAVGVSEREAQDLMAVFGTAPMPPTLLYVVAGTGTAIAVIVTCVGVGDRYGDSKWLRPWVATGQLALTLYVAHVVIGMGALDAFGLLEDRSLPFALGAAGVFCAASVAFSSAWRRSFSRGPLEWIMRLLTGARSTAP